MRTPLSRKKKEKRLSGGKRTNPSTPPLKKENEERLVACLEMKKKLGEVIANTVGKNQIVSGKGFTHQLSTFNQYYSFFSTVFYSLVTV